MAVLTGATGPTVLAAGGGSGGTRWAVLAFQKVTTADTFDCATLTTIAAFSVVTAGCFLSTSNRTATATVCTIASSTNVSLLGTGIAADAGVLLVIGE